MRGNGAERIILGFALVKGLVDTINAKGVLVVVGSNVPILDVLVVVIVVVASARVLLLLSPSPNVLAQSCSLTHPTSVMHACFWLVVACKILNVSHLRPLSYLIFVILCVIQFATPK